MIYFLRVNLRETQLVNLTFFAERSERDGRLTHIGVPVNDVIDDYDDTGSWTGYDVQWSMETGQVTSLPVITVEWGHGENVDTLLRDLAAGLDD